MPKRELLKVISISSGKGGVGKTNVVANLAVSLSRLGRKVVLLDADLGLGNLDVLLGLTPKYNFGHVIRGEKSIMEIMVEGPAGVKILPAPSGMQELTNLSAEEKINLFSQLEGLEDDIDIMLIDTAAGISQNVLFFNIVAGEMIIVASPEPTSIVDAYALIKVLHNKHGEKRFRLLVNQARDNKEGLEVYRNLSVVADRFLNISLDYMGFIPYDENIRKAVREQKPVVELFPTTKASVAFAEMAKVIDAFPANEGGDNLRFFMNGSNLLSMGRNPS